MKIIEGGDTNHYGYVFNDPINLIDETGFHAKWPSYIPFFGWGWTLGEGLYHAFGGQDGDCHDWNEWSNRMMMSTYITVTAGQILVNSGYTGGEHVGVGSSASSPLLSPRDIAGKTPAEIDAFAKSKGLIPKGPDPMGGRGAYVDPVTGHQRILIHGNHGHVNLPDGTRIPLNGDPHIPIRR